MRDKHVRDERGFTLIELMVTVAIVGVLSAVALPLYRDYSVRARVTEVVLATSNCRNVISEAVQSAAQPDLTDVLRGSCDIPPSQYVASGAVTIGGDVRGASNVGIRVEARNLGGGVPDNSAIVLVPMTADGPLSADRAGGSRIVAWKCSPADVGLSLNQRYLPPNCRT